MIKKQSTLCMVNILIKNIDKKCFNLIKWLKKNQHSVW